MPSSFETFWSVLTIMKNSVHNWKKTLVWRREKTKAFWRNRTRRSCKQFQLGLYNNPSMKEVHIGLAAGCFDARHGAPRRSSSRSQEQRSGVPSLQRLGPSRGKALDGPRDRDGLQLAGLDSCLQSSRYVGGNLCKVLESYRCLELSCMVIAHDDLRSVAELSRTGRARP